MNRSVQLKLLNDELKRLFSNGITQQTAFNQLSNDARFDRVRRSTIKSIYEHLQKKNYLKKKKHNLEVKKQFSLIVKKRQAADKLLFYESVTEIDDQALYQFYHATFFFGNQRYVVMINSEQPDLNVHQLTILDLMNNIEKKFNVSKSGDIVKKLCVSTSFFGLLSETSEDSTFISLVKLDMSSGKCHKLQTFKYERQSTVIFMASSDNASFLLRHVIFNGFEYQVCKIVGRRIEFGESFEVETTFPFRHLFCDQFFSFMYTYLEVQDDSEFIIYDLKQKKKIQINVDPLPKSVRVDDPNNIYVWHRGCLYIVVRLKATEEYGIACINAETRQWKIFEFASKLPIVDLTFTDGDVLMVLAKEVNLLTANAYEFSQTVHKIPMRNPDHIRNLAWRSFINSLKTKEVEEPYKAALRYLPYNSDIRCPFVDYDTEEKEEKKE